MPTFHGNAMSCAVSSAKVSVLPTVCRAGQAPTTVPDVATHVCVVAYTTQVEQDLVVRKQKCKQTPWFGESGAGNWQWAGRAVYGSRHPDCDREGGPHLQQAI